MLLALLLKHKFKVTKVLWELSINLKPVAILPQLFMVSKTVRPSLSLPTICLQLALTEHSTSSTESTDTKSKELTRVSHFLWIEKILYFESNDNGISVAIDYL